MRSSRDKIPRLYDIFSISGDDLLGDVVRMDYLFNNTRDEEIPELTGILGPPPLVNSFNIIPLHHTVDRNANEFAESHCISGPSREIPINAYYRIRFDAWDEAYPSLPLCRFATISDGSCMCHSIFEALWKRYQEPYFYGPDMNRTNDSTMDMYNIEGRECTCVNVESTINKSMLGPLGRLAICQALSTGDYNYVIGDVMEHIINFDLVDQFSSFFSKANNIRALITKDLSLRYIGSEENQELYVQDIWDFPTLKLDANLARFLKNISEDELVRVSVNMGDKIIRLWNGESFYPTNETINKDLFDSYKNMLCSRLAIPDVWLGPEDAMVISKILDINIIILSLNERGEIYNSFTAYSNGSQQYIIIAHVGGSFGPCNKQEAPRTNHFESVAMFNPFANDGYGLFDRVFEREHPLIKMILR